MLTNTPRIIYLSQGNSIFFMYIPKILTSEFNQILKTSNKALRLQEENNIWLSYEAMQLVSIGFTKQPGTDQSHVEFHKYLNT